MRTFQVVVCVAISLFSLTAYGRCAKTSIVADLAVVGREGEVAFADMNLEKLLVLSTRARQEIVPCLVDRVTLRYAAMFHRLMALEAFTQNQTDRVVSEFHAARKLEPGYEIPANVAPAGHPLRKLYEEAAFSEDGKLEVVYPPMGGYVTVGGVRNAPRPSKSPVIVQVFGPMDTVIETRYIQPGESLPAWGKNPMGITAKDLGLGKSALVEPRTWYISAGVSAIIAGVLYGVALYNKSLYLDTSKLDTPESDKNLTGYADRANGFAVASIVTGGFAIVFAGTGVGFYLSDAGDDKKITEVMHD